ncbi:MAG: dienelactone hydrolase family protein [Actinomycetota bacterium]|nr:dienelactone hydrolase family protein [Actinomycetota bacterium]
MANIALFHSVLGMRPGILDAADRLRAQGHQVTAVDQYEGRVFDDYAEPDAFVQGLGGYPELMRRAVAAVALLSDGFVCVGFSNGGGMAEYVATQRQVAGVVMCSGALTLDMIGIDTWPTGVPAQIHYTIGDPFRPEGRVDAVAASIRAADGDVEAFDYPGSGHLFTDATLPDEYDAESAELLWQRVYDFCDRVATTPNSL